MACITGLIAIPVDRHWKNQQHVYTGAYATGSIIGQPLEQLQPSRAHAAEFDIP